MKMIILTTLIATLALVSVAALWWVLDRMLSLAPRWRLARSTPESFVAALGPDVAPAEALRLQGLLSGYLTLPPECLTPETIVGSDFARVFRLSQHSGRVEALGDAIHELSGSRWTDEGVYEMSVRELVVLIHRMERDTGRHLRRAPSPWRSGISVIAASFSLSLLLALLVRGCNNQQP